VAALNLILKEKEDGQYHARVEKVVTMFNGLDKVKAVDMEFRNSAE
jgi:hypothetical protein